MGDIGEYLSDLLKTPKGITSLVGVVVVLMLCVIGIKKKR